MTAPTAGESLSYLAPGHRLKQRYTIEGEIGRGGSSIVYRARDEVLTVPVAVKLLVPPPASAVQARERLRREVQVVRDLSHPHVVSVFDFIEEGPWSFVVMEYVDGTDLARRVAEHGPVSPDLARRIGRQLADALAAAHHRGILHRDVKPSNVLLDSDDRVRLADFGSARAEGLETMTATGGVVGTAAYLPPEVLAGQRPDARADIYALGLTLYYALTGRSPTGGWPGQPVPASPDGHAVRDHRGDLPAWLDRVIARATAAHPAHRYATAAQVRDALDARDAPLPDATDRAACVLCHEPDPLGLGLCPHCGGSPGSGDTVILMERQRTRARRHAIRRDIESLLDGPAAEDRAAAVARGERALFAVPHTRADRVVAALQERGLPARAVARSSVWRRLPAPFAAMSALIVVGGLATPAGLVPSRWMAPVIAGLLWWLATLRVRRPAAQFPASRDALPPTLQTRVLETLRVLPAGAARHLLADVIRLAGPLYRLPTMDFREELGALIEHACEAARELADMDVTLGTLDRHYPAYRADPLPPGWLDALSCSEQARAGAVQRFLETIATLARVQHHALAFDPRTPIALVDLAADIEAHQLVQAEARREVERLLRTVPATVTAPNPE